MADDDHSDDGSARQAGVEQVAGDAQKVDASNPYDRLYRAASQVQNKPKGTSVLTGLNVGGDTLVIRATRLAGKRYHVAVSTHDVALVAKEIEVTDQPTMDALAEVAAEGIEQMLRVGLSDRRGESRVV